MVLDGDRNVWRGRVLFVKSGQFDSCYQDTVFGVLAERLTEVRYHVELVSVRQGANGAFNLVDLKRSLADPADLVFITGRAPRVAAEVAASGRPFFQLCGSVASVGGRCVGQCRFSAEKAFGKFFAQYKAKGVRSVRLIAMDDDHIAAPRDLGLVVCANRGFAPVSTRSLTRFEWNAFADGERLAHRVIQYLSRGISPGKVSLPVRYLSGRTF